MKKISYILILILFSSASFFLAYKVAFYIGETYFFDKLFYKKSALFGYWVDYGNAVQGNKFFLIDERIKDLHQLIALNDSKNKVLGTTTNAPNKEYKVAIIGDSIAYGMGVKQQEAFPILLEKELNKVRPTKVYLLAQAGDDLVDNYTKFEMAEKVLDVDLYVFTLVDNDLVFNPPNWIPHNQEALAELEVGCTQPDFLQPYTTMWPNDPVKLLNELYYPSFSPQYTPYCILQHVAKKLPANKTLLLSVFPYIEPQDLSASSSDYDKKYSYVMDTYSSAFRAQGDRILSVNDYPDFKYIPVSEHEGHPSATTHQMYANILFQEITTNPQWRFAAK